jgi:hypothetical protein
MRYKRYLRPILLLLVSVVSCRCAYIGYRGSLGPEPFAYALERMPDLMDTPAKGGGPYTEIFYMAYLLMSAPFAFFSTLAFIIWLFKIPLPPSVRLKPKK